MKRIILFSLSFLLGMIACWYYEYKLLPSVSNFKTSLPDSNWRSIKLDAAKQDFLNSLIYKKYENLYLAYSSAPFRGESSIYSIAITGRLGWCSQPHENLKAALTYSDDFINNDSITSNLYKRYEQ